MTTGKSSDPNWLKMTLYLQKETRSEAMQKVIRDGGDLSGVVDRLVAAWAAGHIDLAALPSPKP